MNASKARTRTSANRPQTFVTGLSRRPALGFLGKLAAWSLQTRAPDTDGGTYALVRQRRRSSSHGAQRTRRTCGDRCGFGPGLSSLGTAFHRRLAVSGDLHAGTSEGRLAADALISVGELEYARQAQHTGEPGAQAGAKRSAIRLPAVRNLPAAEEAHRHPFGRNDAAGDRRPPQFRRSADAPRRQEVAALECARGGGDGCRSRRRPPAGLRSLDNSTGE